MLARGLYYGHVSESMSPQHFARGKLRSSWDTARGFHNRDILVARNRAIALETAGKVALLSAKKHAPSLLPVLLFPGSRSAFIRWFEQQGGLAFHHRTSLLPRWQVSAHGVGSHTHGNMTLLLCYISNVSTLLVAQTGSRFICFALL